jgi:hypothetical protein
MRKLPLYTFVLAFGVLAFAASQARAAHVIVSLSKDQVHNMCGGQDYCQKTCGSDKQYTCEYGCGTKGCGGGCLTCPQRVVGHTIRGIVLGTAGLKAMSDEGASGKKVNVKDLSTAKKTDVSSPAVAKTTTAPRDASTGQATGRRVEKPIR